MQRFIVSATKDNELSLTENIIRAKRSSRRWISYYSPIMINKLYSCKCLQWLSLCVLRHDWFSKGSAPPEWLALLAPAHAVACRQALGQRGCLLHCIFGNIHYASNLLLRSLHICPFKDRQKGQICQRRFKNPTMGNAEALAGEQRFMELIPKTTKS